MPASVTPVPTTGGFTVPPTSPLSEATARLMAGAQTGAAANRHAPASNTAAVITKSAAAAGIANVVSGISWSYDDTPTGGSIQVEDGSGTVIFSAFITTGGPGFFPFTFKGSAATALIITLAAGGSGVSGVVNVASAWTELA